MRRTLDRHERELAEMIRQLGGSASRPPAPDPSGQYLSFLSLKFLIPKLIEAKKLMIDRYDHALSAVDNEAARALLQKHIREMNADLAALNDLNAELVAHK